MELEDVLKELKKKNLKKVFIQLPEGLIIHYEKIAKEFEKEGIIPVISIETTYGYCDLKDEEALRLGCDAIVHFGHNNFGFENMISKIPVYFVEWFIEADYSEIIPEISKNIEKGEKIGIVYSLQYKHVAEKICDALRDRGIDAEVLGQILGCNISNVIKKRKDKIFIISSGKFYGLYPSFLTSPKTYLVDLENRKVLDLEDEVKRIVKIKEWNKKIFLESKKVGLLVSWKKGQVKGWHLSDRELKEWEVLYEKIKGMNKEVYVLAFDELEGKMLEGIKVDILINLACPRLGIDDILRFKIPILNPEDIAWS